MFIYSILPLHDAQCFEILCKWIRKGKLKQWNFETSLEAIKTYSNHCNILKTKLLFANIF